MGFYYFVFIADDIIQAIEWDIVAEVYEDLWPDKIRLRYEEVYC